MYLSCLLINTGTNPDRPRPGRLWLRNMYRVHQRLCMAFPSFARKSEDAAFLAPYRPDDFARRDVHVRRKEDAGFLFRVDPKPDGHAVLLVLSANEPDWDYAFHNARHLLIAPPECRPFQPSISDGGALRFRLVANPTRKIDTKTGLDGQRRNGRRVPVSPTEDAMRRWLETRAAPGGFRLRDLTLIVPGYVYVNKSREPGSGQRLCSVRYEGALEVTDTQRFHNTLTRGIGPAKAFGFGLLSVAPVR